MDPNVLVAERTDPTDQEILVAFLKSHHEKCSFCNYDLHQLQSDRCPECGRQLKLQLNIVNDQHAAWIATAVVLSTQAGIGVIFWLGFLDWLRSSHRLLGAVPVGFILLCIYLMATVPAALASLILRRQFLRTTPATQKIIAALTVVLMLAALLDFYHGIYHW